MSQIATSSGMNPDVDTVVRRAYQLAALIESQESPNVDENEFGKFMLSSIMKRVEVRGGPLAQLVELRDVVMVPDQRDYDMESDVLNVFSFGMYADPGVSTTEGSGLTSVQEQNRGQYHTLSVKGSTGRPYIYFPDRNFKPLRIKLWPIPDEAGTIRFQMQVKMVTATSGNTILPFDDEWIQYFVWELASQLATGKGLKSGPGLGQKAESMFMDAKAFGNQQAPQQAHVDHMTGWS